MKLPLTEEFLWDIYNFLEKTGEITDEFFVFPSRSLRSFRYSAEIDKLRRKYERKKARRSFSQFIYYLKRKGYIKIRELEGKNGILLTRKGTEKVLKIVVKQEKKKKRKDGKWLMLIFDIPEKKRGLRNFFRRYLQTLGFKMLQQSVWVCPYDVIKEVEGTIRSCSLDSYIKIFLIEEVEL